MMMASNNEMIAITTNSSIRVKAFVFIWLCAMGQ
jgi:hypothetical protein